MHFVVEVPDTGLCDRRGRPVVSPFINSSKKQRCAPSWAELCAGIMPVGQDWCGKGCWPGAEGHWE